MLLHQLVIPTLLFPFAVHSLTAADIVPANQALTEQTEQVNDDVNQMDIVAMQVPKDLQSLVERINSTVPLFTGVAATSQSAVEQNIADSYTPLTDAIQTLMENLIDRKEAYEVALEGKAIYQQLNNFEPVLFNYGAVVISLLKTESFQNEIGEADQGAFASITDARNEYEPTTITTV